MTADPFSDILRLTNAQTVVSAVFVTGGPWAVRFPALNYIKFFALVKGGCWLCIDGQAQPVRIAAGDVVLFSLHRSFVLASDLALEPVEAQSLFTGDFSRVAKLGEGEDCIQIGGKVKLDPVSGGLLEDVLPPLIHVRASSPQATVLQWLLDQIVRERSAELPGANVASGQLAQLMLVQVLRAHLAEAQDFPPGWLRALGDARIAPALRLMHGDPARPWQLEELASAVAMSRTTFALRFKTVAGVPPLTYLSWWRMRLAERSLREERTPLLALALSLGYASESAFSNAFKRIVGMAPTRYREAARSREQDAGSAQAALNAG
jgi:AraC-like DNA-binding protein